MFEKELRPTPAALIDEKFMAEIEAFFPKANGVQRTFGTKDGRTATCGFKQRAGRFKTYIKAPNSKRLPKEFR